MANIDDVMNKLEDVLDKINDNKEKIAEVSAQIENLELVNYKLCTMCHGDGTVIPSHDLSGPIPEVITCPSCGGVGRYASGGMVEKD